jgi:hypothetical protein
VWRAWLRLRAWQSGGALLAYYNDPPKRVLSAVSDREYHSSSITAANEVRKTSQQARLSWSLPETRTGTRRKVAQWTFFDPNVCEAVSARYGFVFYQRKAVKPASSANRAVIFAAIGRVSPAASISLMPGTICLIKTDKLTNDHVGIQFKLIMVAHNIRQLDNL